MDAFAGTWQEQGTVQRALDQLPCRIQELTRQPVQRGTGVGALVEVGEEHAHAMYQ